jgi:hypothetical protein
MLLVVKWMKLKIIMLSEIKANKDNNICFHSDVKYGSRP